MGQLAMGCYEGAEIRFPVLGVNRWRLSAALPGMKGTRPSYVVFQRVRYSAAGWDPRVLYRNSLTMKSSTSSSCDICLPIMLDRRLFGKA